MDGVAATEQHEVAGFEVEGLHRLVAVENLADPFECHIAGVGIADCRDMFEVRPTLGCLQQHRDGKGRVVEVPAEFHTFGREVHVDRRHVIGIGINIVNSEHATEERTERRVVVNVT